nr:hypothetical protein [Mycobacterium leprae]
MRESTHDPRRDDAERSDEEKRRSMTSGISNLAGNGPWRDSDVDETRLCAHCVFWGTAAEVQVLY